MILKKTIYNDDKNYAPREGEQIFGPNENRSTAESPIVQAQMAREDAAKASKRASEAVKAAGEAAEIANAVNQKVWSDDSGLHISDGNQDAAATRNTIWNSLGMLFRKGLNPILGILTGDNPRVAIYDGQGSGEDHEVASFGASARIGKSGKNHLQLDDDSVDFMNGDTLIGYVGSDSARFPVMHVQSRLSIGDKYELRVTPSGSLGLYLM